MSGEIHARAILFDLDGVLVDSKRCIERVWQLWAAQRGVDPDRFIALAPGRKTSETLRLVAPELDVTAEAAVLDAMEESEQEGLTATAGARELLTNLPPDRWAIVTSGSGAVARLRLKCAGLPVPEVLVTGEQVRQGKPHPAPYLLGAARMNLAPTDCVVIEDAPPGIESARAAGMRTIAVQSTHPADLLSAADVRVPGLDRLRVALTGVGVAIRH